jgi:hypothetical protein
MVCLVSPTDEGQSMQIDKVVLTGAALTAAASSLTAGLRAGSVGALVPGRVWLVQWPGGSAAE